jgi:N-acetylated-alpha-linked acidic dipeptidase
MWSKSGALLSVVILGIVFAGAQIGADEKPLTGFTPERSAAQRQLEEKFLAVPDNQRAEATHATLTAEPHVSGSAADRRVVEYLLEEYRKAGFETEIEEFHVLLPDPKRVELTLLEPVEFAGPRPERVPEDPASNDPRTLPGFNGYSGSGNVTGDVVYAHYGLPADYDRLRAEGVAVKDKIVIARYGRSFRGVKAKVAEENQAAGLIIYSDPNDDGYHAGDAYPNGPWRPESGVQRGSVLYIFEYPGDPTTPDGPSVEGADRIAAFEAKNMPRIPVLPISYADARVILENLGGPAAPREWQGGLAFTYHLGPGPAKARLRVEIDHVVKPIWNVVAKIRGRERPDEIVVLGNHHDAWTYGGVDPNSGTTSMLELARGLGALLKEGWRPRRSIWMCEWDGEEQGLLGSTEWTEKHATTIREKVVAYLNLDSSVSGFDFDANAVPSLKPFLREVAAATPDPRGGTVLEHAERLQREELRRQVVPGRVPSPALKETPIADREFKSASAAATASTTPSSTTIAG